MLRHIKLKVAPVLILSVMSGCTTTTLPLLPIPVPIPRIAFLGGDDLDFSGRSWTDACRKLLDRMRKEYPYTERKGINWDALETDLLAKVETARQSRDKTAYHAALRGFAEALHDGNVNLSGDNDFLATQFEGGFGIELTRLDDGRIVVSGLRSQGPADLAGVPLRAEVLSWNGNSIADAISSAPLLWAGHPPATASAASASRLAALTRASIGSEARVLLRLADASESNFSLTADRESWAPLESASLLQELDLDTGTVLGRVDVQDGIGYIQVNQLASTLANPFPGRAFRNAVHEMESRHATALVLDLRGESGGLEEFAAEFFSCFATAPAHRNLAMYNRKSKAFEIDERTVLNVRPQSPGINIPTVVLIDGQTRGAGEILAWSLQTSGYAKVAGNTTSAGVTPVPDRTIALPGGFKFTFPIGRWLAPDGTTPVESNAEGAGGVVPDIRTAVTEDTLRAASNGDGLDLPKEVLAYLRAQSPGNARP